MRFLISLSLSFLLFTCADLEKSKQLSQQNSLVKKNDSLFIVLNQIDDQQLKYEIKEKNNLISTLKMFASSDTLFESEARLVHQYLNNIELLDSVKSNLKKLKISLEKQKMDLKNLGADIMNGFGKRNMYNQNLSFEQEKSKIIEDEINLIRTKKINLLTDIADFKLKTRELNQKLKLKQITK